MRSAYFFDDGLDLGLGAECEAMQDGGAKGASRWFQMWLCPVDPGHAAFVVSAVGIFTIIDNDARMEEAAANRPEDGG